MRILVVDDSRVNLEAAKQTLAGHDLTVCDNYDEAVKLLEITHNKEMIAQKLIAAGLPTSSDGLNIPRGGGRQWSDEENARWNAWWDAHHRFTDESVDPFWDAVLVDLLMPAGRDAQGEGRKFVGQLMPVGFALALLAAKNGAKYVAVVTATNHHNHPASALLDRLSSAYWQDEAKADFVINGAKAGFFHHPQYFVEGAICPECNGAKYTGGSCGFCSIDGVPTGQDVDWEKRAPIPGTVCKSCDGTKKSQCYACRKTGKAEGKDWGKVLAALIKE